MIIDFMYDSKYFIHSRNLVVFVGRCPIPVKRSELLSVFSNNCVFIGGNSVKVVGVESQALHDDVEFFNRYIGLAVKNFKWCGLFA